MYAPGVPPNVAVFTGPLLLGALFNVGLFGALSVQVYVYHLHFIKDQWKIKTVVYSIYIWELVQTILIIRDAFTILGSGWGDLAKPLSTQLLWFSLPMQTGVVSLVVQSFFAWRIFILGRSKILVAIIVAIALTAAASSFATGVIIETRSSDVVHLHQTTFITTTLWLVASAACDFLICFYMCWFLGIARRRTTYERTSNTLTRLILLTVGTGVLTACVSAVDCAFFLAFQENNLHFTPAMILGKLYSNSLMVLLNNRLRTQLANSGLRWDEQSPEHFSGADVFLGGRRFTAGARRIDQNGLVNVEPHGMMVRVEVQTEEHHEMEMDNMTKQVHPVDTVQSVLDSKVGEV